MKPESPDLIQPVQRDAAFLADVEAHKEKRGLRLWWLGQSGFLIQWNGRHLLFDPYLSDSLTRKYAATDKPHVRMSARVVDPARLGFVDVVTSTHNHTDHLDAETLGPMQRANPSLRLVIPEANRAFVAERLGRPVHEPIGLDGGTEATVAGFHFTGVPAAHNDLDTDAQGRHRYLGYLVRFGPWTLYHSGDTRWYDGLEARLRTAQIDVALLPINGHDPRRRVAGNLNGREAAALAHQVGARFVIPCHYDMFTFNTASPAEFVEACTELGQAYRVLQLGAGWAPPAR